MNEHIRDLGEGYVGTINIHNPLNFQVSISYGM